MEEGVPVSSGAVGKQTVLKVTAGYEESSYYYINFFFFSYILAI